MVSAWGRAEGERIEAAAIGRAKASVYPSEWAVRSACSHYGASPATTRKVTFGANLNDPPSRASAIDRRLDGTINLLLVGVNWERKGGPVAYQCLTTLLARGIDARLTLVGCVPPAGFTHSNFRVIPFLSKHDPGQRNRIRDLFLESHFMLLPTIADATPVVTCEASAFGLPTLASDTGGLRGAIRDGVNGFLMPEHASGEQYAQKILDVIADPGEYEALVLTSRNEYEQTLNWDSWGESIRGVMEDVLARKIQPYAERDQLFPTEGKREPAAHALMIPSDLPAEVSRV